MDVSWMITIYVMIDTTFTPLNHHTDCRARLSDTEIVTIALVAAKYFGHHHERAVQPMIGYKLIPTISVSRFNRRLHALADWMHLLPSVLGEVMQTGEVYVIDSIPVPVCRRVRARRCRKVRGREYCGYCAAKVDDSELQDYRHTIETVNSQLESMGTQRLRARTNIGFDLKVQASVLALICTNMN